MDAQKGVHEYQLLLLKHALDFSDKPGSTGCILRNQLYIGDVMDCQREALERRGITTVVSLNDPGIRVPQYPESPHCEYYRIRIWDRDDADITRYFEDATRFIDDRVRAGKRVLVHCAAGVSRSATICIAYLIRYHSLSFLGACSVVKAARLVTCPNYGFLQQLVEWEKKHT